jgi:hypothetical protein
VLRRLFTRLFQLVVDLYVIDINNLVHRGRRQCFVAGPQLAQAAIELFIELYVVLEAPARRRRTRWLFPRGPPAIATTAVLTPARGPGFSFGRSLAQFRALIPRRTFRGCILPLRFRFALRSRALDLGLKGDNRLWFGFRLGRTLHAELTQHASPMVAPFRSWLGRTWFRWTWSGSTRRWPWRWWSRRRHGDVLRWRFIGRIGRFCARHLGLRHGLRRHAQ